MTLNFARDIVKIMSLISQKYKYVNLASEVKMEDILNNYYIHY